MVSRFSTLLYILHLITHIHAMDLEDIPKHPLHNAAIHGNGNAIHLFIDQHNIDVNSRNSKHETPLMKAVKARQMNAMHLLLAYNADVNATTTVPEDTPPFKEGKTPLTLAIMNQDYKAMKLLLRSNADPNLANKEGWRPLHCAIYNNFDSKAIKLLKQHGANETLEYADNWLNITQWAKTVYKKSELKKEYPDLVSDRHQLRKEFTERAQKCGYRLDQQLSPADCSRILDYMFLDEKQNIPAKKRERKQNEIEKDYQDFQALESMTARAFAQRLNFSEEQLAELSKNGPQSLSPRLQRKVPARLRRTNSSPHMRLQRTLSARSLRRFKNRSNSDA